MLKLQVIIASTREGRRGLAVANWAIEQARTHGKFDVEVVDLAQVNLPLLDEPKHPRFKDYKHEHTKRWSETVSRGDAYLFVLPEYDHTPNAAFINAMQYLSHEWAYKAAALVTYGGVSGGTRAGQGAKSLLVALKVMPMVEAVNLPFFEQHMNKETGVFDPGEVQAKAATVMLDELLKWSTALTTLRG